MVLNCVKAIAMVYYIFILLRCFKRFIRSVEKF